MLLLLLSSLSLNFRIDINYYYHYYHYHYYYISHHLKGASKPSALFNILLLLSLQLEADKISYITGQSYTHYTHSNTAYR